MTVPKKILVPTDLSPSSKEALIEASRYAKALGASLELLHVWEYPAVWGEPVVSPYPAEAQALVTQAETSAREAFKQFADEAAKEGLTVSSSRVLEGVPERVIVEVADADEIDLIVMGSHGRGVWERLFIGSVTERVVRSAHCPVLVVKGPEAKAKDSKRG